MHGMRMTYVSFWLCALAMFVAFAIQTHAYAAERPLARGASVASQNERLGAVTGIRIGDHQTYTRFVIDMDHAPAYRIFTLGDPYRVVIDLPEVAWKFAKLKGTGRLIREMRYGRYKAGNSRLVLDMKQPIKVAKAFVLPPTATKQSYRVILDLKKTNHGTFMANLGRPLAVKGVIPALSVATALKPKSAAPKTISGRGVGQDVVMPKPAVSTAVSTPPSRPVHSGSPAVAGVTSEPSVTTSRFPVQQPPVVVPDPHAAVLVPTEKPSAFGQSHDGQDQTAQQDRVPASVTLPKAKPAVPQRAARTVIVLDAGHGGIDPGTIGQLGTREKVITLAMARELRALLEATGRYKVVLTRDSDKFIPLRERVAIARHAGGDLFVSLHADSIAKQHLRGLSVYTLSENASDAEAALLANKENKADLIGGLDLTHQDKQVTNILIDLAQRETKNFSAMFARNIVASMRSRKVRLLGKAQRAAGFAVLKAPDVPSVLVELGFLSNITEERLLKTRNHRHQIGKAIVAAINDYFAKQDFIAAVN